MLKNNIFVVLLTLGLIFFVMGCIASDSTTSKNKAGADSDKPVVGGIAVGVSPKIIYADKGDNISFTVDLLSTENADDRVTISINGTWINKTLVQDIEAGANVSVPVHITVPSNAGNMSFMVKATSHNLNATSSTAGMIFIKK